MRDDGEKPMRVWSAAIPAFSQAWSSTGPADLIQLRSDAHSWTQICPATDIPGLSCARSDYDRADAAGTGARVTVTLLRGAIYARPSREMPKKSSRHSDAVQDNAPSPTLIGGATSRAREYSELLHPTHPLQTTRP
jgi:hypothetical protein